MLNGPFPVRDLTATPTTVTDPDKGRQYSTYPLAAGVHYTADAPTFATNTALLTPYLDAVRPLQFVMEGDDPANPTKTYPLVFPDAATANGVILQM